MKPGSWQLPGYVEVQELGAGAQGRVVLARHEFSGAQFAIKYLSSNLLSDTRAREIFRNEAELLKRVTNPHVTRLIDYIDSPQGAAIIMEAVPGHSLRRVLDRHGQPLTPETALILLKGSLQGLAAAHSVGVIHRDYKPANVIVRNDGQSKLLDFGVAGLSGQGGIMGTPAYMAPEQWAGGPATPATDVYAATCVFYECVTGHKPYGATTQPGLRAQHITAPLPVEDVPEPLRPLIVQGMAKDPGRRQWDISSFTSELEGLATANYGPDWERRGLVALGAAAAVLTATIPVTFLSGGILSPGAVVGTTSEAGHALGSQGLLTKIGGVKGAASAGAATAAAVMVVVLFWPEGATVGGTSSGDYRAYFHRPGVVLDNATIPDGDSTASPTIREKNTISPARVRAGTRFQLENASLARTPWGLQYLGPGNFRCHSPNSERGDAYHSGYTVGLGSDSDYKGKNAPPVAWLYPSDDRESKGIPTGTPIMLVGKYIKKDGNNKGWYDYKLCAWTFDSVNISEFVIPTPKTLKPGRYKVARFNPVGIGVTKSEVNERRVIIDPDSAGARVEGSLPTLTVLAR
ncbi:serine/threonine-protein kinase [Actinomadura sp. 9N407]|uniref:serine/threonine-protein kinase n=1 Tax=Actinomadura sp. 9N407 TaxID=3375154 RepID=UPI0037961804